MTQLLNTQLLNTQLLNTLVSRIQVEENIKVIRENLGDIRKCVLTQVEQSSRAEPLVSEQKEKYFEEKYFEDKYLQHHKKMLQLYEDYDRRIKECRDKTLPLDTRLNMFTKLLKDYPGNLVRLCEENEQSTEIVEFPRNSDEEFYAELYQDMREEELKIFEEDFKKQFADLNEEQLNELREQVILRRVGLRTA